MNGQKIKVNTAEKTKETLRFIQEGESCLMAAEDLFKNPFYWFPASVLCHHGIELLLKACLIWDKCYYLKVHELSKLILDISFLKLTQEQVNLIKKIDTFYYYRYPLNEKDRKNMEKTHAEIDDKEMGRLIKPGELGSHDWDKVSNLHQIIIGSMPNELYELYSTLEELQNQGGRLI